MASVWSAQTPFCPRCGTLLVFPDVGDVVCDACDYACRMRDMPALTVVTRSYPKPVPEWLAEYHAAEAARAGGPAAALGDKKAKRAVVNEECPKCKSPRMEFYTMQLRSADEGQTVRAAGGGVQSCARAVLPSRCTARRLTARRLVVPSRPAVCRCSTSASGQSAGTSTRSTRSRARSASAACDPPAIAGAAAGPARLEGAAHSACCGGALNKRDLKSSTVGSSDRALLEGLDVPARGD